MNSFRIIEAGLSTTIQDTGRRGMLGVGITQGGVTDPFMMALANTLVSNPPDAAVLELTLGGLQLEVTGAFSVCLTGAPCELAINGSPADMAGPHHVTTGDLVTVGKCHQGIYSFLAMSGGIDTAPVLGSRSTVVRESLGGLGGRRLRVGDILVLGDSPGVGDTKRTRRDAGSAGIVSELESCLTLRFIRGLDWEECAPEAAEGLLESEFSVASDSNRMAIRLTGSHLQTGITEAWSEATCYGCIQVPTDGEPFILINDRQTMGGYPKLGAVIATDCVRLTQARAGTRVTFQAIALEEAKHLAWLEAHYQETLLQALIQP